MTKPPTPEPSAIVIPFGKHKGKTVAELLAADPSYADWITAQAWVAERFAELHAAILTRGAGTDDSPEHNALQARFLVNDFTIALLRLAIPTELRTSRREAAERINWPVREQLATARREKRDAAEAFDWVNKSYLDGQDGIEQKRAKASLRYLEAEAGLAILEEQWRDLPEDQLNPWTRVTFEASGVDVVIVWAWTMDNKDSIGIHSNLHVELKPSMGDDFPSVLRQMRRLRASVLVIGAYTGRGASEPQMRAMFEASGITVVFVQEIEEAMRHTS